MAEGNVEIINSFHKMLELQNREGAPKQYSDELKLEYNNIGDTYRKIYKHLSDQEIEEKLELVFYNIEYDNALALSRLRQRILDYVVVIKSGDSNL